MLFFSALGFVVRDDRPDFEQAEKGFDVRGSDIAGGSYQWKNIRKKIETGELTYYAPQGDSAREGAGRRTGIFSSTKSTVETTSKVDFRHGVRRMDEETSPTSFKDRCCSYSRSYAFDEPWQPLQIVFEPQSSDDLFDSVETLIAMCKLEELIMKDEQECGNDPGGRYECTMWNYDLSVPCQSRSLGNYVGFFHDKPCIDITQNDVDAFKVSSALNANRYFFALVAMKHSIRRGMNIS